MNDDKIKILIVDDSKVTRDLIKHLLSVNPHVDIVGAAENGEEAFEFICKTPPDVVLTDIVMPKMNGIELTKKIMETHPMPVIVMSGIYSADEIRRSFDTIDAGAIAVMEKPRGIADEHFADTAKFIFDTARVLAGIREFSRANKTPGTNVERKFPAAIQARINEKREIQSEIKGVAVGSSIGGPKALQKLLSKLTPDIRVPIFIVQHISAGFVKGFADWLNNSIALEVSVAKNGEEALPGHVYIAPDKFHMMVDPNGIIALVDDPSPGVYLPSIGKFFQSFAKSYGSNGLAVLLIGAEKDGIRELQFIKNCKGLAVVEASPSGRPDTRQPDSYNGSASIEEIAVILKEIILTR